MPNITNEHLDTNPIESPLAFFQPLLPWQAQLWQTLIGSEIQSELQQSINKIPHSILAAGVSGIGKRQFVWRWVAWQLCYHKKDNLEGACGNCDSCRWLKAGNHPDLKVVLQHKKPGYVEDTDDKKSKKSSTKTRKKGKGDVKNNQPQEHIKIDDVRSVQEFVHRTSSGLRICVFDDAESMTIAAANALLKTLEEPSERVRIILLTDNPAMLLPTIKSRVQQLPLTRVDKTMAMDFVKQQMANTDKTKTDGTGVVCYDEQSDQQIEQLLDIADHAPLFAVKMFQSDWYPMRAVWLTTWLALRSGSRTAIAASQYWQAQLSIADFFSLTRLMLSDLLRLSAQLPTRQRDIDFGSISLETMPTYEALIAFKHIIDDAYLSVEQNIQQQVAYDMILEKMVHL